MATATSLGFPRIGDRRQLKTAVEGYWRQAISASELHQAAGDIRKQSWMWQKEAGIDHIPSNDFSFYDHILDMTVTLGLVPRRYGACGDLSDLDRYFAMARGRQADGLDVTAMEMTKWFDTNYHYIVPEFDSGMTPCLSASTIFDQFREARDLGVQTRPVLIGPASYLALGKAGDGSFDRLDWARKITPVYNEILDRLASDGALWVQFDEPVFCLDLSDDVVQAIDVIYDIIDRPASLNLVVTSYFDSLRDNAARFFSLPVQALHIDLCRGPGSANTEVNDPDMIVDQAVGAVGDRTLSLGIVDGRNIWKNDLSRSMDLIERVTSKIGHERVMIAPSCSLIHAPVDLENETDLDPHFRDWMAFARQKLGEIAILTNGATHGRGAIADQLEANDAVQAKRASSPRIHNTAVKERLDSLTPDVLRRSSTREHRYRVQKDRLGLPAYPATTIGSFPQTAQIRKFRADHRAGRLSQDDYVAAMKSEIRSCIEIQHEIGLDVLVHGEPERNDMVEYFGEHLDGFVFTRRGWVQSYGTRCVKPPVIVGDVARPGPITLPWISYAQSLTSRPLKGMLTGPATILQWSFVRDDQPRLTTARQIALAIRDEVADLEASGIAMIQIDEAAFREGLPLRRSDWDCWLEQAAENFRIASSCVGDQTQIHTHMCYSEFDDIIEAIAAMDADVISIETSRSGASLLDAFARCHYPADVGPGVYDIHSPRVPEVSEMVALLSRAREALSHDRLWVNPDCGLKTRGWPEVKASLVNMVEAARQMRASG